MGKTDRLRPSKVVSEDSASITGAELFELDSDHFKLNKFASSEEPNYKAVSSHIHRIATGELERDPEFKEYLRALYSGVTEAQSDYDSTVTVAGSRIPGSCEWILKNEKYVACLAGNESRLLCLHGAPGIGKTMISLFLVDTLKKRAKHSGVELLAYFLCDAKDHRRRTATQVLRSLLVQLLQQQASLFKHIKYPFSQRGDDLVGDRDALWRVLLNMLQKPNIGQLYFILDALDECDSESQQFLLVKLKSLFLPTSGAAPYIPIKLIMTSRPSTDMDALLSYHTPAILGISIHSRLIQDDLEAYINQEVDVIAREKSYPEELTQKTKAKLRTGAEGTFLWAALLVEDLRRAALSKVEGILENLPKGLYGVYDQILSRIDEHDTEQFRQILYLVMASERPLSQQELAAAVISGKESQHCENHITDTLLDTFLDAHTVCQPLLRHDDEHNTVTVFHQSVNDYFRSNHLKTSPKLSQFYFKEKEANFLIFKACWRHYATSIYGEQNGRLSNYPLGQYAPQHWLSHATQSSEELLENIEWPNATQGLFLLNEWLLTEVKSGRHGVVALLLEHGADCSAVGLRGFTALHYAAEYGHIEVARELLDRGADVNQATESYRDLRVFVPSWTFASIYFDLEDFKKQPRGWDTFDNHKEGRVALHCAAAAGNADMIHLLLTHGADILATSDDHSTAVGHAEGSLALTLRWRILLIKLLLLAMFSVLCCWQINFALKMNFFNFTSLLLVWDCLIIIIIGLLIHRKLLCPVFSAVLSATARSAPLLYTVAEYIQFGILMYMLFWLYKTARSSATPFLLDSTPPDSPTYFWSESYKFWRSSLTSTWPFMVFFTFVCWFYINALACWPPLFLLVRSFRWTGIGGLGWQVDGYYLLGMVLPEGGIVWLGSWVLWLLE